MNDIVSWTVRLVEGGGGKGSSVFRTTHDVPLISVYVMDFTRCLEQSVWVAQHLCT